MRSATGCSRADACQVQARPPSLPIVCARSQRRRRRQAVLVLTEQAKELIKGTVEEIGPEGDLRLTPAGRAHRRSRSLAWRPAPLNRDEVVNADGRRCFSTKRRRRCWRARQHARHRGVRGSASLYRSGSKPREGCGAVETARRTRRRSPATGKGRSWISAYAARAIPHFRPRADCVPQFEHHVVIEIRNLEHRNVGLFDRGQDLVDNQPTTDVELLPRATADAAAPLDSCRSRYKRSAKRLRTRRVSEKQRWLVRARRCRHMPSLQQSTRTQNAATS